MGESMIRTHRSPFRWQFLATSLAIGRLAGALVHHPSQIGCCPHELEQHRRLTPHVLHPCPVHLSGVGVRLAEAWSDASSELVRWELDLCEEWGVLRYMGRC